MHKIHITNVYKHVKLYIQAQQHSFLHTTNNNKGSNNSNSNSSNSNSSNSNNNSNSSNSSNSSNNNNNNNKRKEKEYGIHIYWNIIKGRNRLQLAAAVGAEGWVGIVILEVGGMLGSNMVVFTAKTETCMIIM